VLSKAAIAACSLWIFLGDPYIEKLRGNEDLTTTLSAIVALVELWRLLW
jgi:hypothetical protein